jgi:hypothetical protein
MKIRKNFFIKYLLRMVLALKRYAYLQNGKVSQALRDFRQIYLSTHYLTA